MFLYDALYNRLLFARWRVQCREFPRINGRVMIADFTPNGEGGTVRIGRKVVINSAL